TPEERVSRATGQSSSNLWQTDLPKNPRICDKADPLLAQYQANSSSNIRTPEERVSRATGQSSSNLWQTDLPKNPRICDKA
ncbi:hypothetical protein, partial [Salmonella enterica]|uniref:hypothetical protein n=1 Tax=Salmonella enterica TaxID=28901 RepID=UPI002E989856|nr:hypothetical protein [Salmonella enterica subsp. enterica serovar Paratyphi A]